MRILTAEQHHALDQATMQRDGISSTELMERAATAFTERFVKLYPDKKRPVVVLCGPGNNGGDGMVIARLLRFQTYTVRIILAKLGSSSDDNQRNQRRARDVGVMVQELHADETLPSLPKDGILIDALFGTGLSRPVEGYWAKLIEYINDCPLTRVSVDLPSGLYTDQATNHVAVKAERTLSLGYPKLALYSPSNTKFLGKWELVSFSVDDKFAENLSVQENGNYQLTASSVKSLLKVRYANDHKGTFGHALLVAGSFGKMGAAVISARAILRAGAGLLTAHVPRAGYEIMQISFPEAMCSIDRHRYEFTSIEDLEPYDTIGVGPGLGTESTTQHAFYHLVERYDRPMVIDADGLNLLAKAKEHLAHIPAGSILTPHPKEFERLFGDADDDFARWEVQRQQAQKLEAVVLLKTGYTSIATPDGKLFFSTRGNPGMGTAGTGDALTGVLTGLLAQGYDPTSAAKLGVYLHGLAGDIAAEELEQESLLAEDVVSHLGKAFRALRGTQ